MSVLFICIAFLAAVNAPRRRLALPEADGRVDPAPLAAGVVATFGLAWLGIVLAEPFLDAIDVAPESFEIAAGLVVVLAGAWAMVAAQPGAQPGLPGWGAAIVPVVFPLLLSAEVVALLITFGALEDAGATLLGAAIGLGAMVPFALIRRGRPVVDTLLLGLARISGLALVVVGVQLIVEGVRDV